MYIVDRRIELQPFVINPHVSNLGCVVPLQSGLFLRDKIYCTNIICLRFVDAPEKKTSANRRVGTWRIIPGLGSVVNWPMVIVFVPKTWGCGTPSKGAELHTWLINGCDPTETNWDDLQIRPLPSIQSWQP